MNDKQPRFAETKHSTPGPGAYQEERPTRRSFKIQKGVLQDRPPTKASTKTDYKFYDVNHDATKPKIKSATIAKPATAKTVRGQNDSFGPGYYDTQKAESLVKPKPKTASISPFRQRTNQPSKL